MLDDEDVNDSDTIADAFVDMKIYEIGEYLPILKIENNTMAWK